MKLIYVLLIISLLIVISRPSVQSVPGYLIQHSSGVLFKALRSVINLGIICALILIFVYLGSVFCIILYHHYRHRAGPQTNPPLSGQTRVSSSGDYDQHEFYDILPEVLPVAVPDPDQDNSASGINRIRRRRMLSTLLRDNTEETLPTKLREELVLCMETEFVTPPPSPKPTRQFHLNSKAANVGPMAQKIKTLLPVTAADQDCFYTSIPQQKSSDTACQTEDTEEFMNPPGSLSVTEVSPYASVTKDDESHPDNITAKGTIYLHQFPRAVSQPCLSCDGMYLETYIRHLGIIYKVTCDCLDSDGPWIASDMTKVYGLRNCMKFLREKYPENLNLITSTSDPTITSSWSLKLLLDHLHWGLKCWRWAIENAEEFRTSQPGWDAICENFENCKKSVKGSLSTMGFGKMSADEVIDTICKDFETLSTTLGGKLFLLGENSTQIDCFAFSILCQIMWGHESILRDKFYDFTNLSEYCNRIRNLLWPDWEEELSKPQYLDHSNCIHLRIEASPTDHNHFVESEDLEYASDNSERSRFKNIYYKLHHSDREEFDETEFGTNCVCSDDEEVVHFCADCTTTEHTTITGKKLEPVGLFHDSDLMHTYGVEEYFDDDFEDMERISYASDS